MSDNYGKDIAAKAIAQRLGEMLPDLKERVTIPTPVLIKRDADRGWIAVSPPDYPSQFAAIADTPEGATEAFMVAAQRWWLPQEDGDA